LVAVVVGQVPSRFAGIAIALPLLIAGIGGGMVISPNTTLTLECVPPKMAGVAGGALQTGQRIGTAIGTAVLTSVFHATVVASGGRFPLALSVTMLCSVGLTLIALGLAIAELRGRHRRAALCEAEQEKRAAEISSADVQRN
jgi:MFS family permease